MTIVDAIAAFALGVCIGGMAIAAVNLGLWIAAGGTRKRRKRAESPDLSDVIRDIDKIGSQFESMSGTIISLRMVVSERDKEIEELRAAIREGHDCPDMQALKLCPRAKYGRTQMTKTEGKELIKTIQAWIDGKPMQSRSWHSNAWEDDVYGFNGWTFGTIRVKPEPVARPWTFEECPVGITVKLKNNVDSPIMLLTCKTINGTVFLAGKTEAISMATLFHYYVTEANKPCGVLLDDDDKF